MTCRCLTALAAALAAVSCGYPTFEFLPTGSSSSASSGAASSSAASGGGAGGAMSSAESSSSAQSSAGVSSSGTGGPPACALGHLVISEIRSRGMGSAADEFIELYNAASSDVTLGSGWLIEGRSATAAAYSKRWQGSGKTIPRQGHYLIAGTKYLQLPAEDDALTSSITDASSLRLTYLGATIDAVCYSFDALTASELEDPSFTCEGTPTTNGPHDDTSSAQSNIDASLERRNQGCADSGVSATDFKAISPAHPENTASPAVP